MTINSSTSFVNNKKFTLDTPAKIINNRTFSCQLDLLQKSLGTNVDWDNENRVVVVGNGYEKIKRI